MSHESLSAKIDARTFNEGAKTTLMPLSCVSHRALEAGERLVTDTGRGRNARCFCDLLIRQTEICRYPSVEPLIDNEKGISRD